MSPYHVAGVAALAVAYSAGLVYAGHQWGLDSCEAANARDARVAALASEAASQAAADAISRIEVRHVTIRQPVETRVIHSPVYRDCRHDPDVLRGINAARTGRAEPAGGGELPGAAAAD